MFHPGEAATPYSLPPYADRPQRRHTPMRASTGSHFLDSITLELGQNIKGDCFTARRQVLRVNGGPQGADFLMLADLTVERDDPGVSVKASEGCRDRAGCIRCRVTAVMVEREDLPDDVDEVGLGLLFGWGWCSRGNALQLSS